MSNATASGTYLLCGYVPDISLPPFGVTFRTESQSSQPAEAEKPAGNAFFGLLAGETPKVARRRRSPKAFPAGLLDSAGRQIR
jgi:hypothetical protein